MYLSCAFSAVQMLFASLGIQLFGFDRISLTFPAQYLQSENQSQGFRTIDGKHQPSRGWNEKNCVEPDPTKRVAVQEKAVLLAWVSSFLHPLLMKIHRSRKQITHMINMLRNNLIHERTTEEMKHFLRKSRILWD